MGHFGSASWLYWTPNIRRPVPALNSASGAVPGAEARPLIRRHSDRDDSSRRLKPKSQLSTPVIRHPRSSTTLPASRAPGRFASNKEDGEQEETTGQACPELLENPRQKFLSLALISSACTLHGFSRLDLERKP
ncbi:hypothetical protein KM043_010028 [Ampulex compressa]|nr:hypothetical protein KM043_010028 [Ampulex compressa]